MQFVLDYGEVKMKSDIFICMFQVPKPLNRFY